MTTQAGLFDRPAALPSLRDYQTAAVDGALAELQEHRGTLVLMATGLGKTQVACELIRRASGRCLFIAHRDELIQQASRRIEQFTDDPPDIEQATLKADREGHRHVVASVQTLSRPHRLERFDPSEFELIVIDECHRGTAKTYRRIIDYFDGKLIGLTATPDRTDREALGQILDSVAYRYDLLDAIRDGWLCEIVMRRVRVDSMDFSGLHTLAGDFNEGELAKLMLVEKNLHAIAKPTVDCAGERRTIVFATSVAHAERLAEIIDRYAGRPAAMVVSGSTPIDTRHRLLREYHEGKWQYFVNVGIATEGYDEPAVSCIAMGRPTKSRSLYVQMLGRGTRGGTNCRVEGKSDCLVLDFVGNSGRHEVISTTDVLGGDASPAEIDRAKVIAEKSERPKSVDDAVKEAKEELAHEASEAARKRRGRVVGEVTYGIEDYNPYVMFGVKRDYLAERYGMAPATQRQVEALQRMMGKNAKHLPQTLSKHEASRMLGEFATRRQQQLSTYGQIAFLARKGIDARQWAFARASAAIDWSANHGWQRPPDIGA